MLRSANKYYIRKSDYNTWVVYAYSSTRSFLTFKRALLHVQWQIDSDIRNNKRYQNVT
ncbi:hypothetical protein FDI69_gp005 [Rhodococcus phage Trina]|uniref:Uncharacterized protein n=1 Tax=Rhodococcus phage Trina TaxID=2027905 RepID=A0A2D0ZWG5_9CAUD|nr:hypothetical protein FDI69_gp005 [Rhodococcus phage Trina]ASZ74823.1 hypothetical protein SEA_TRINA_5 [Rhodococcus phage Trina]